jgi:hypothetical protein
MSRKNKQSNSLSEIRRSFHRNFSTGELVTEINFSYEDEIRITEHKNTDANKLKTVIINLKVGRISDVIRIEKIWQVNLETIIQDDKLGLGASQQSSTCECALIILTLDQYKQYNMNVCLIELKTDIGLKILESLIRKIRSNMNAMYLFLTLNNHDNPAQGYEGKEIKTNFKGIIFYNKTSINENQDVSRLDLTQRDLLEIFKRNCKDNLLEISTFLKEKDKIGIKFFKNPNKDTDEMEISIQDLIT